MHHNNHPGTAAIALAIVASALLLAGCSGGYAPVHKDVEYYKGSDGLILELTNDETLKEIYESTNFALSMSIENAGAFSVTEPDEAVLSVGFDPFYIETLGEAKGNRLIITRSNIVAKGLSVIGKSRYYPTGSKIFFYFPYFKTRNVTGQQSKPDTQIFASLCYPYATTLSTIVCIDFDVFKEGTRSQVCTQSDLSLKDQGAPVAITLVEVENLPVRDNLVKPVFTLHMRNVGRGSILSPKSDPSEIERVCTNQELSQSDFNMVDVEAWLSNNIRLECTPNTVRLNEQEGITRCTIRDEDIADAISFRQNYQAPLTVNITYLYQNTLKQDIKIKRVNPYGDLSTQNTEGCLPFEVRDGDECVNKCDFCAKNPDASECNIASSRFEVQWNAGFGCKCSQKTCNSLYPDGLCTPFSGFCPVASYCCTSACSSSEQRYEEDGKCYPKCSDSCSEIKKACLCGDETTNILALPGSFCSEDANIYSAQEDCKAANDNFEEPEAGSSPAPIMI